jgi:hypothetical protein
MMHAQVRNVTDDARQSRPFPHILSYFIYIGLLPVDNFAKIVTDDAHLA